MGLDWERELRDAFSDESGGTMLSGTPTQTKTACGRVSEWREGFVGKTEEE
jgi:hypothetical protein